MAEPEILESLRAEVLSIVGHSISQGEIEELESVLYSISYGKILI